MVKNDGLDNFLEEKFNILTIDGGVRYILFWFLGFYFLKNFFNWFSYVNFLVGGDPMSYLYTPFLAYWISLIFFIFNVFLAFGGMIKGCIKNRFQIKLILNVNSVVNDLIFSWSIVLFIPLIFVFHLANGDPAQSIFYIFKRQMDVFPETLNYVPIYAMNGIVLMVFLYRLMFFVENINCLNFFWKIVVGFLINLIFILAWYFLSECMYGYYYFIFGND